MKKIFIMVVVFMGIGCACSSKQDNSAQERQQHNANPPQSTGGISGTNAIGGTGGIDPETPGGASVVPYRPCALHPCAQRLPDPETDEDLKYSLPK